MPLVPHPDWRLVLAVVAAVVVAETQCNDVLKIIHNNQSVSQSAIYLPAHVQEHYIWQPYLIECIAWSQNGVDVELGKLLHGLLHSPSLSLFLCICILDNQGGRCALQLPILRLPSHTHTHTHTQCTMFELTDMI